MSERWICGICGYVHKGSAPPDKCPTCGAPFTAFEKRVLNPKAKFRKIEIIEERPAGFRYVIIGNSAAGQAAATAINALDDYGEITIISEESIGPYSRPMLPDLLGGMDRDDFLAVGETITTAGAPVLAGETVERIDPETRRVICASGAEVAYDALLLATGSAPVQIPWPGSDTGGIAYFRTLDDAQRILDAAEGAERAVVVGGGLLGLEFVRAFHLRGLKIAQLVRESRVGAPGLDEEAGGIIQQALVNWGVELALEDEVDSFEATGGKVCAVKTKAGRTIECDLVGVAIGARPRVDLAESIGLQVDRGILVNRRFQSSAPDIYAAGDVAQAYDRVRGAQRVNTSWRNSKEQGEFAGICMAGGAGEYPGSVAINFQLAAGLPFCAMGIANPRDPENFEIACTTDEQALTWRKTVMRDGALVGACLVGDLGEAAELEEQLRAVEAPEPASEPSGPETTAVPQPSTDAPTPSVEETSAMKKMTEDNLNASFAGESQAHMKYKNFAKKAGEEGKGNVARLFNAASFAEQVHASHHLEVLDGIGSTSENLGAAADGENFEIEEMYPAYMAVADVQDETDAYESFNYAIRAEEQHRELYTRAKEAVDAGGDAVFGDIHVCPYCGFTLEGDAPAKCPVCGAPAKDFVKF